MPGPPVLHWVSLTMSAGPAAGLQEVKSEQPDPSPPQVAKGSILKKISFLSHSLSPTRAQIEAIEITTCFQTTSF